MKLKPISVATGFLQCFYTVGLVVSPVKIVAEMIYIVSSGMVSLYSHSQQMIMWSIVLAGGGGRYNIQSEWIHKTTTGRLAPSVQLGAWPDRLPWH